MKNETVAKLVKGGIVLLGTAVSAAIAACVHAAPENDVVDFCEAEVVSEEAAPAEEISDPAE